MYIIQIYPQYIYDGNISIKYDHVIHDSLFLFFLFGSPSAFDISPLLAYPQTNNPSMVIYPDAHTHTYMHIKVFLVIACFTKMGYYTHVSLSLAPSGILSKSVSIASVHFYFYFREGQEGSGEEGEALKQAPCLVSTLRWPEPKSRVDHSTN